MVNEYGADTEGAPEAVESVEEDHEEEILEEEFVSGRDNQEEQLHDITVEEGGNHQALEVPQVMQEQQSEVIFGQNTISDLQKLAIYSVVTGDLILFEALLFDPKAFDDELQRIKQVAQKVTNEKDRNDTLGRICYEQFSALSKYRTEPNKRSNGRLLKLIFDDVHKTLIDEKVNAIKITEAAKVNDSSEERGREIRQELQVLFHTNKQMVSEKIRDIETLHAEGAIRYDVYANDHLLDELQDWVNTKTQEYVQAKQSSVQKLSDISETENILTIKSEKHARNVDDIIARWSDNAAACPLMFHGAKETDIRKMFEEESIVPDFEDDYGNTLLHYIVMWEDKENEMDRLFIAAALLDYGLSPTVENAGGMTPYYFSLLNDNILFKDLFEYAISERNQSGSKIECILRVDDKYRNYLTHKIQDKTASPFRSRIRQALDHYKPILDRRLKKADTFPYSLWINKKHLAERNFSYNRYREALDETIQHYRSDEKLKDTIGEQVIEKTPVSGPRGIKGSELHYPMLDAYRRFHSESGYAQRGVDPYKIVQFAPRANSIFNEMRMRKEMGRIEAENKKLKAQHEMAQQAARLKEAEEKKKHQDYERELQRCVAEEQKKLRDEMEERIAQLELRIESSGNAPFSFQK